MNKDWNPTDEDIWLSNAARELFGFPVIQEWIINPNYVSIDIEYDIPSVYKSVYFDGTGITDKGKKLRETIVAQLYKYSRPYESYDYLHSAQFIANRKASIEREMKQPISEHRVCPYCGKSGVVGNKSYDLWEDNGEPHACPVVQKSEGGVH